jgi:hypothetical protein
MIFKLERVADPIKWVDVQETAEGTTILNYAKKQVWAFRGEQVVDGITMFRLWTKDYVKVQQWNSANGVKVTDMTPVGWIPAPAALIMSSVCAQLRFIVDLLSGLKPIDRPLHFLEGAHYLSQLAEHIQAQVAQENQAATPKSSKYWSAGILCFWARIVHGFTHDQTGRDQYMKEFHKVPIHVIEKLLCVGKLAYSVNLFILLINDEQRSMQPSEGLSPLPLSHSLALLA